MNLSPSTSSSGRRTAAARGFTLPEMMTAMAVFLLAVAGIISLQIFGLKMNALAAGKLRSTAYSLKVLNQVRDRVLGANSVTVGNGSSTVFTATGTTGNALQVYPGTNTTAYVRFYFSTNNAALYELNSTNNQVSLVASNLVNQAPFSTVDFQGNISSSSTEHYAIRMTLQFAQVEFTIPTNDYDYYTLQTEMTPRIQ